MCSIRNIAIIAHVDHGKTTLVDLLQAVGTFRANQAKATEERIMDSMDLEREKGITIRAKNAAFKYKDYHINIVDTPGHADFGGEVERIMNMIDGVLLVVDAADGPQAQTQVRAAQGARSRREAHRGHQQDRPRKRQPHKVLDMVFELFVALNATDEQLDFPVSTPAPRTVTRRSSSTTTADDGAAVRRHHQAHPAAARRATRAISRCWCRTSITPITSAVSPSGELSSGKVKVGDPSVVASTRTDDASAHNVPRFSHRGHEAHRNPEAHAGDIVGLAGFEDVFIGETITDTEERAALPFVQIDPPTIQMKFRVNDGPLAGRTASWSPRATSGSGWSGKSARTSPCDFARPTWPNIFNVSGAAKCRSPFSSSRCAAKASRSWFRAPKSFIAKTTEGKLLEPIENALRRCPERKPGRRSCNPCRPQGRDH